MNDKPPAEQQAQAAVKQLLAYAEQVRQLNREALKRREQRLQLLNPLK